MTKWKKDMTEFEVGLFHNERRGYMATILRPIVELLDVLNTIVFVVKNRKILVKKPN